MANVLDQIVSDLNLAPCDLIDLEPRRESFAKVPDKIADGPASGVIAGIASRGRLWKHQSLALRHLARGRNVVVSTGTASGKSLIFQSYAFHLLATKPESKILVFYPLRALAADQMEKWTSAAGQIGLPTDTVARIDGSVRSDRESLLERARVVIMTPDVCHAWFMRLIGTAEISKFLERLELLVLDEAHVYESVFGSNAAYLIRRLLGAKRQISPSRGRSVPIQAIAATATIADPAEHLESLTGLKYHVVSESDNGAPVQPRRIVHVEGDDSGQQGEAETVNLLSKICQLDEERRFIAFMDSRQGVDRVVYELNNASGGGVDVLPYRSGYEEDDRRAIEIALRNGKLRGVVSTSALELGIDISDLDIGVNLGVPQSRKSFRQRLGRVGRNLPGLFIVVAPPGAFRQFGENLTDYFNASVEPSYLYLGNRFLQFAHARCVADEMEQLGRKPSQGLPKGVEWPSAFENMYKTAQGGWSQEFEFMAQLGGNTPHLSFPLRQLAEINLRIQRSGGGDSSSRIGDIAQQQAIREAFPGANYLHVGRPYWVNAWRHGFNEITVQVAPAKQYVRTRPIMRKRVVADVSQNGIVERRIIKNGTGYVAEVQLQINESVEGYTIGNTQRLYKDLRSKDPRKTRKQRDFRTTGIIIQIDEDWFTSADTRSEVATGLREFLCRDKSIASHDVDNAHNRISELTATGPSGLANAIVVYDSVYGGLRLTESLFDDFARYVSQISAAADMAGVHAIVSGEISRRLCDWSNTLEPTDPSGIEAVKVDLPDGFVQVFKRGSVVGVLFGGGIVERTIIKPVVREFDPGNPELFYQWRDDRDASVTGYTPVTGCQIIGDQWELEMWNPDTDEFRDIPGS